MTKSIVDQARGNAYLTELGINVLLREYDNAKSDAHKRYIIRQLDQLGYDRDYLETDHGNDILTIQPE